MDFTTIINQPNTKIIDVREPYEFIMRHVDGAENIPLGSIPSRLEEFRNIQGPIIFYCASGNRSGQAAGFLRANGIEEAYNGGGVYEMEHYMAQVA